MHHWTHAILVTIEGHESGYKFPLTEDDHARAAKLKKGLQGDPKINLIDDFHHFIKPLLYSKTTGRSEGDYTRWDDPFEGLFALAALQDDGTFKSAQLVTQAFAQMKYHICGGILRQALIEMKTKGLSYEE